MVDTSPGKVQALRAMFTQKNEPVMGIIPTGGKMGNRPWKRSLSEDISQPKATDEQISALSTCASEAMLKALQRTDFQNSKDLKSDSNDVLRDKLTKVALKPSVGPKPAFSQQNRTLSNTTLNVSKSSTVNGTCEVSTELTTRIVAENNGYSKTQDRSRIAAEAIASFMFADVNGANNSVSNVNRLNNAKLNSDTSRPIPKPRNLNNGTNYQSKTELSNGYNTECEEALPKSVVKSDSCTNLISSDNYICKGSCNIRRKELPPKDKLGQAPLKPVKTPYMTLSEKWTLKLSPHASQGMPVSQVQRPARPLSQKPTLQPPQRPLYPCPPRPSASPPAPPSIASSASNEKRISEEFQNGRTMSLLEEIDEELYEDTLLEGSLQRPISLIPEYTAEEEQAEDDLDDLYDDAGEEKPILSHLQYPTKPKNPPPPPPSGYLDPTLNDSTEELYQDADDPNQDEFYEVMPVDLPQEEFDAPLYSNNRKEIEKLRKEEEKRMRKELKDKEKKGKEMEKLKRKFGLTGEEIPIDAGLVKADSRGGKNDLPVRKGETVLILRIEGNPSGKWLVKNGKGKYGYVELTNIEVDPESVKSASTSAICELPDLSGEAEKTQTWLSKFTACVR